MPPRIWTDARSSVLADLWKDHTPEAIAELMGLSQASVKCQAMAMRLGPAYRIDPRVGVGWPKLERGTWPKVDGAWESIPNPGIDQYPSYGYVPRETLMPSPSPGCAAAMAAAG